MSNMVLFFVDLNSAMPAAVVPRTPQIPKNVSMMPSHTGIPSTIAPFGVGDLGSEPVQRAFNLGSLVDRVHGILRFLRLELTPLITVGQLVENTSIE